MVKKGFWYILFILFIYSSHALAQECFTVQYDTSALNKDIQILKKTILFNHPSVQFYGEYDFYKNYLDTALQIKSSMTEKEFRMLLKSKLSILRCGHTNILPSKKYMKYLDKKSFKVIPYFITYDNKKLIVVKGFDKKDTLLKTYDTILEINKIPSENIIHQMKNYLYTDGFAESAKEEMIQRHFTFYFSGLFEKDSFLLTIKNQTGTKEVIIKTREYLKVVNQLVQMQTDTLLKQQQHHKYFAGLFLDKQKKIYYMKIKSFSGIVMKHQFRRTFRNLKKNKTEYLVIDLRNNPGGKISQSISLLSYLLPKEDTLFYQKVIFNIKEKKHIKRKLEYRIIDFFLRLRNKNKKLDNQNMYAERIPIKNKNQFNGHVYLIVNAQSFSAANLVAVYLSKRPDTKIAGSEPSGVIWGSNAVSFLRLYLPNTKILTIIPTYRIFHNMPQQNNDKSKFPIKPNIITHYHADDLLFKKDKELEVIYFDIMKNIRK
ncbi:MAG: S41 family peptidase [Bacteroidia bacterium]|nr:S41 family peptidase [Bacteroidia bacterium]